MGRGVEADAVVLDGERDIIAVPTGGKSESAGAGERLEAMLEGVFHDRLEEEGRHGEVKSFAVEFAPDGEALAEAPGLDGEVVVEHLEFLMQRDEVIAAVQREGAAQQVGEVDDHFGGIVRFFVDFAGDDVEGIEEEMGVKL